MSVDGCGCYGRGRGFHVCWVLLVVCKKGMDGGVGCKVLLKEGTDIYVEGLVVGGYHQHIDDKKSGSPASLNIIQNFIFKLWIEQDDSWADFDIHKWSLFWSPWSPTAKNTLKI